MKNLSEAQLAAALAISVSHIHRFRRRADRGRMRMERTLRGVGGVATTMQMVLRTAAQAMGGPRRLADTLGVPQPDLEALIAGNKPPPGALVFLALVLVGGQSSRKDHDKPSP
jgi:hypothetical protein